MKVYGEYNGGRDCPQLVKDHAAKLLASLKELYSCVASPQKHEMFGQCKLITQ